MMRRLIVILMVLLSCCNANAQRKVDNLGRGLVAVPLDASGNSIGTLVSWRRLGTEYYDVTYNLYYGDDLLASGLTNTNYTHGHSITGTETYQVAAVVQGVEQEKSPSTKVWPGNIIQGPEAAPFVAGYMDIPLATVYDRNGSDVTANYLPNDAEFADLDGDGELEMIIKRLNTVDAANVYPQSNTTEFVMLDAYDINWQEGGATLMWRIDCGPNMVSLNSTEINIIAFDWDEDGQAEVVLRGADNMIVYGSDGLTRLYTIGNMAVNTRNTFNPANGAQFAWTHTGAEYLIYMNGRTGALFQQTDYPLKRLEYYSTLQDEWGGRGYGHNSSKYFFGAPYLDGHTANLFLARGIYGTHKMIAMNLNKKSHQWSELWRWKCNDTTSPWYGNGYHNFIIADVDEDGRDEIVYGSMVIDDNGMGLHTTGYGHGDAQHVSDFNPWRKGLEFFGCLEDEPNWGSNYRDATTGEVLYKFTSTGDDGRAMAGNFRNDYPGGQCKSSAMGDWLSTVTQQTIGNTKNMTVDNTKNLTEDKYNHHLNFCIYWDEDLLSEIFDSGGSGNGYGTITKAGQTDGALGSRLINLNGITNNDSKNNSCFQGDLMGDWREEVVMRLDANTVRIFTTGRFTEHSLPTLWHDHQYRQAMVWQMMAYNQPPHLSYFLGEMEGITVAPPPLITNGRILLENNASIDESYNGKHLLLNEYANTSLSVSGGTPEILTINVPAWVQGHNNNNNITTTTYTCSLTGGALNGSTRLVKQGNGILSMANAVHTHSGATNIWGGTVIFDGTLQNSSVWMNRHTTLNSTDGHFDAGLTMEYGATLNVGGATEGSYSRVTVSELTLNYGACVVLDVNGNADTEHDWLNAATLNVDDSKVGFEAWENYGPENIVPVIKLNMSTSLGDGLYPIGHVNTVIGDLSVVKLECDAIPEDKLSLVHEDGILYLQVSDVATASQATIEITGMTNYADVSLYYPSASSVDYYLPVVSIVANNTSGQSPTLSGTFTSLDGTVTNIGSTEETELYAQDYENETDASSWTTLYAKLELLTNNTNHHISVNQNNGGGPRSAYTKFYSGNSLYSGDNYSVEFDAAIHYATDNKDDNYLILFGEGASVPSSNALFDNTNYLFKISGGKSYGTSYTVEGSNKSYSFTDAAWYHYVINVDKSTRKVSYTILSGNSVIGSQDYYVDESVNMNIQGMFIGLSRYNSYAYIDNIVIKSSGDILSSYTFTEPGTLRVTSAVEGYASGIKTFEAKYPFIKIAETGNISADYLPVSIHDEKAADLPLAVANGNAHLYRTKLTTASSWSTMVVPFDMTASLAREMFGENVVIANIKATEGDAKHVYFETSCGEVYANQPFLVKNVTKDAPYLVMGITSEPVENPSVQTDFFDFIGRYTQPDGGIIYFNTDDYFFNASTGNLSTVKANNTALSMNGYRAYFHALSSEGAKSIALMFVDAPTDNTQTGIGNAYDLLGEKDDIYDLQGRKVGNGKLDGQGSQLKPGVYIQNRTKVVIK